MKLRNSETQKLRNSETQKLRNSETQKLKLFVAIILLFMVNVTCYAQDTLPTVHYYYVEEQSPDILKPTAQNRLADHSLDLSISRSNLQSFFDAQTVYVFKKAFPGAINPRLQNMYLIGLDDDNVVNPLRNLNQVVYADYIGTLDNEPLSVPPGDYESTALIPTQYVAGNPIPGFPNEHLKLVNAKQAWNITTGDPNVVIGIVDGPIYPQHPDLQNKIIQHYGNEWTPNPGQDHQHGTKVVGCAAADTNNFDNQGNPIGIASIGYNSSIITSTSGSGPTPLPPHPFDNASTLPQQMLYLVQNHPNIKVLTHSRLESCGYINANALVYEEIWTNYSVTVITAAGNGNWKSSCPDDEGGEQGYVYPASYDHVISVGAVGHHYKCRPLNANGNGVGWKDSHQLIIGNDEYTFTRNDKIDVVAPGYGIPTTDEDDDYSTGFGTSFSGPFVCGIAALMYAVHPSITPDDVRQILRDTADDIYHIPENQQYIGKLGTGRVNAYAAVRTAECLANPTTGIDLMTLNSDDDFGNEPDDNTDLIWESDDIWVRNQQDPDRLYADCHEDLQYIDDNTPVYVYVRVTNDGCSTSSGNDQLELYWAKGGLNQTWPDVWNGSNNPTDGFDIGNQINVQNIPALETGESTILEFEWFPQNPDVYENAGFEKPWMFCFLSRIVSPDDPMTFAEVASAATNARNNNNIAYKNTTVINVSSDVQEGTIFAGNLGGSNPLTSTIQFSTSGANNNRIWQESEVYAELDDNLWDAWQDSNARSENVNVASPEKKLILLNNNKAKLKNINFNANQWGKMTIRVNFLVKQVEAFEGYDLHIQQTDSSTGEVLGGFTYTITRDNSRQDFTARDETEVDDNNLRTIKATNINEPATYNWYDEDGNLIYSGDELTINTSIAKEYKLEVIADSDGHKDYHTVVTDDLRQITSINPNPANTQVTIQYLIEPRDNAFIKITHVTNGAYYNYILDDTEDTIDVDLTNFSSGQYIVNLIAGGQVLDSQNLIIN